MNIVKNEIIKELSKKYGKKENLIRIMVEKSFNLGYDLEDSLEEITSFLNQKTTRWQSQLFVNNEQIFIKWNRINQNIREYINSFILMFFNINRIKYNTLK